MVRQSIDALSAVSVSLERPKSEMRTLAVQLPEHSVVMTMRGVGDFLCPQLIAKLGEVSRITHRNTIITFAGIDPDADKFSPHEARAGEHPKAYHWNYAKHSFCS